MDHVRAFLASVQRFVQWLSLLLFALLAIGLVTATGLSFAGVWPWPDIEILWRGEPVPQAGQILQLALTVFAITLCFFMPANRRILALENTHRRFNIALEDIEKAYISAHAADRAGLFQAGHEFEDMKSRLTYLRDHPDFRDLEPELLEIAAQMSFASRELSERYSDARVARARSFLEQRQQELELFNQRIEHAKAINTEFKTWINRLDLEENVAAAQMDRLLDELEHVLPELSTAPEEPKSKVAHLPKRVE